MSLIQVATKLDYKLESAATFIFSVMPALNEHQMIQQENLILNPYVPYEAFNYGPEGGRMIRVTAQAGFFTLDYAATVALQVNTAEPSQVPETPYAQLPPEVLAYLNPSRYCEADLIGRFAYKTFEGLPTGYTRVMAVVDWVYKNIEYIPGTTNASSSASDVLLQRAGVCRDFAHLSVTLCRALGIPARYISAYAPGLELPADFHGVFEAYLGGKWYFFDATRMAPTSSFVRISTARDAADASFATIVGKATMTRMQVEATNLTPQESPSESLAITTS
ncbi:MAG: transglutaminase family protein [Thiothrix sp.]|nr:MAG: transglutaminase family protein [Thiothrix sp.]